MTKTKKNFILTLAAFILAALFAVSVFTATPRRSKADAGTPDLSNYEKITDATITHIGGLVIAARFEEDEGDLIAPVDEFESTNNLRLIFEVYDDICIMAYDDQRGGFTPVADPLPEQTASSFAGETGTWLAFYIPTGNIIFYDFDLDETYSINLAEEVFNISNDNPDIVFYGPAAEIPTEPEQPDNPGETPDEPDEPDGPSTPETGTTNKPVDVPGWLIDAGDNASSWLSENAGINVAGSTILTVGAIVLIIVVARILKRRR